MTSAALTMGWAHLMMSRAELTTAASWVEVSLA
jgi:hypothetical protein